MEICKALKYERKTAIVVRAHCIGGNFSHKYELISRTVTHPVNWPADSQKYDFYINKEGLRELVLTSQQPQATLLAEKLGINIHKHKYMSKENNSIEIVMKTFDGEEMIIQFPIGKYRINLYFLNIR